MNNKRETIRKGSCNINKLEYKSCRLENDRERLFRVVI